MHKRIQICFGKPLLWFLDNFLLYLLILIYNLSQYITTQKERETLSFFLLQLSYVIVLSGI